MAPVILAALVFAAAAVVATAAAPEDFAVVEFCRRVVTVLSAKCTRKSTSKYRDRLMRPMCKFSVVIKVTTNMVKKVRPLPGSYPSCGDITSLVSRKVEHFRVAFRMYRGRGIYWVEGSVHVLKLVIHRGE